MAASVQSPIHVRDYVRLAGSQFGRHITTATAQVILTDPRFCWAGQGMYGLYRHGPLPGPRSLEPAARLVLTAADAPLTLDAIDYCLKQMRYRYNPASLRNAINRSLAIKWRYDGLYDHPRGEAAERDLRNAVAVVPSRQRAAWLTLRARLSRQIANALNRRAERLDDLGDPTRFGLDWTTVND